MDKVEITKELINYKSQGFDEDQLEELRQGMEDELNVKLYARLDMPASEMAYLRKQLYLNAHEAKETVAEQINKEEEKYKEIKKKANKKETAYISIVFFAITVVVFIIFLAKAL